MVKCTVDGCNSLVTKCRTHGSERILLDAALAATRYAGIETPNQQVHIVATERVDTIIEIVLS